jgi:tetratricopeptide (TPR) repeat protein
MMQCTHCSYGDLLAEMERWEEAEEQYKLALDRDPSDADIHRSYGNLLTETKRLEEAEEQYKIALKINQK